jgi:hypothetical protein
VQRYLVVRIPLRDTDPKDMILMIDTGRINLGTLLEERYENIDLAIEEAERVS